MTPLRWPGFHSLRKLSPDEAAEFAARVAELTKAGLPLGAGLRALADELPGRRLPRVLRRVADRLDAGDDLLGALESQGAHLPAHLRARPERGRDRPIRQSKRQESSALFALRTRRRSPRQHRFLAD